MDKQTLSNYGWLVIVTLILAVMLALATPFGTYVGDAVVSVANGFVGSSNQAMDEDNIGNMEQQWAEKLGSASSKPEKLVGSATLNSGVTLTWEELKLAENGTKYGYKAYRISDTHIGTDAFVLCGFFRNITLPDGIISIGECAFEDTTSIESIVIPATVTEIGSLAFNCSLKLTNITYTGTMEQWNNVSVSSNAFNDVPATVVHCADGDITL